MIEKAGGIMTGRKTTKAKVTKLLTDRKFSREVYRLKFQSLHYYVFDR